MLAILEGLARMKTRHLGNSALGVSAIGYACMGLTGVYGTGADRSSRERGCLRRSMKLTER